MDLGKGMLIDITDVSKVGEGEEGLPFETAIRANRLNSSSRSWPKTDTSSVFTRESLQRYTETKDMEQLIMTTRS